MSATLKSISINLELGQKILTGHNHKLAEITKIEFNEKSGEVDINTTAGPMKALTFRLCANTSDPLEKYRN